MQGVLPIRVIETVERVLIVSDRMNRIELRSIEEAARPHSVCGNEPSEFGPAQAQCRPERRRAEGSVLGNDIPSRSHQSQTRTCRCIDHETGLVAELGVRSSRYQFHRLNGIYRNLRREILALLVADRLAVDVERRLRMVTQRMEKSIRIRHNGRRRQDDGIAETRTGSEGW